jgi:hypothetical protein
MERHLESRGQEIRSNEISSTNDYNADDGGKKRDHGNHRGGWKGSGDKDRNTKHNRGKDKGKKSRRTSTVESGIRFAEKVR